MNDSVYGISYSDILKIKMAIDRNHMTVADFIESLENPEEQKARVDLLKARLKRIQELTIVNV